MSTTLAAVATPDAANTADRKSYADVNQLTIAGRVAHAEIKTHEGREFLTVQVISTLADGTDGASVRFTDNNGILSLFKRGYLTTGRRVHLHGHLSDVRSHYVSDGQLVALKRPEIRMTYTRLDLGATSKNTQR